MAGADGQLVRVDAIAQKRAAGAGAADREGLLVDLARTRRGAVGGAFERADVARVIAHEIAAGRPGGQDEPGLVAGGLGLCLDLDQMRVRIGNLESIVCHGVAAKKAS